MSRSSTETPALFEAGRFTDLRSIVLGGHCRLTLRSAKSGERRTYEIVALPPKPDREPAWIVKTLVGPDNTRNYVRLGMVLGAQGRQRYRHGSTFQKPWTDAPPIDSTAAVAIEFFFRCLGGKIPAGLEVFVARRCNKCRRWLTVPESIEAGLGPTCRGDVLASSRASLAAHVHGAE